MANNSAQSKEKTFIASLMQGEKVLVSHRIETTLLEELARVQEYYNGQNVGKISFQRLINICIQSGLDTAISILEAPKGDYPDKTKKVKYKSKNYSISKTLLQELKTIAKGNGTTLQEVINHTIKMGFEGMKARYS